MKKIERKDFLKIGGGAAVGGLAGILFSGAPFQAYQLLIEWTQDQYAPGMGEEKFINSICEACPDKCEITIRMISDRAVKMETSNGGCPFGQNAIQLLYHPERIHKPLKRIGKKGSGKFTPVSWEQALDEISGKINTLINEKKNTSIAAISREKNLSSQLLERLIASIGSGHAYHETSLDLITSAALNGFIEYDFDNSDFILSFGAKLLEGWGKPGEMQKAFIRWKDRGTKLIQIDTLCTRTSSIADEWIPVKPGTEPILALGMANYLMTEKHLMPDSTDYAQWSQIVINRYPLSTVSELTGVKVDKIKGIADRFCEAKNPVAVAGRGARGISSSSVEVLAVYCLNSLAQSKNVRLIKHSSPGNTGIDTKNTKTEGGLKRAAGFDDFIKNKDFRFLIVNEADPVYKSVFGNDLKDKMEKAFVVSIMPLINNTASYSDYVLPSLSFLEAGASSDGVIKPYENSIHAGDIIINLAKKIDGTRKKRTFPWDNYIEAVKDADKLSGKKSEVKEKFSFHVNRLKKQLINLKKNVTPSAEYPLFLIPFELSVIGDGDGLAFPYVLKAIDGKTFSNGKLWVHMNIDTAKKYKLSEGNSIDIISERGMISSVKVHITETVAPEVIAIPLGFGHTAYTKYAKGKGVNPKVIMANDIDPLSGNAIWWSTRVKIS